MISVKQSVIRTLVPVIVGLLVQLGLKDLLGLDDATLNTVASAIAAGAYYVGVRLAEKYAHPLFGVLLGMPGAPSYPTVPGEVVSVAAAPVSDASTAATEDDSAMGSFLPADAA